MPAPLGGGNRKPRVRRASELPSSRQGKKKGCCAMAAAGRAARRGRWRLARRYAAMSVRLVAARVA